MINLKIFTTDLSSFYEEDDFVYFSTVGCEEIEKLSKQIELDLKVEHPVELSTSSFNAKPFLRIKCNRFYLDNFKTLLNQLISTKIVDSYPFQGDVAMLSLFEEKHILDEIKSIEKRHRCIIKHNKVNELKLFVLLKSF